MTEYARASFSPTKVKRPDCYALPLKSRAAIADFLLSHKGYRADYGDPGSLFAWDVKLYGLDLSWEKIAEKGKDEYGHETRDWWEAAEKVFRSLEESDLENLYEWATEDARRGVIEDDVYSTLWAGPEISTEHQFAGRSGGYIILTKFEGWNLSDLTLDWPHILRGDVWPHGEVMPYSTLRKLYELVVMHDHDLTREHACDEVEYLAAGSFFSHWEDEIDEEMRRVQQAAIDAAVDAATIRPTVEELALAG